MSLSIIQTVDTPAERLALELAVIWDEQGKDKARDMFNQYAQRYRLTVGEASAAAHVINCMVHGKAWKKGPTI